MARRISILTERSQECDAKVSSDAKSLLGAVLDVEFIFDLALLKIVLLATSNLSSLYSQC